MKKLFLALLLFSCATTKERRTVINVKPDGTTTVINHYPDSTTVVNLNQEGEKIE